MLAFKYLLGGPYPDYEDVILHWLSTIMPNPLMCQIKLGVAHDKGESFSDIPLPKKDIGGPWASSTENSENALKKSRCMFSLLLSYGGGTAQGKNDLQSYPRGVCLPFGRAKQKGDICVPLGDAVWLNVFATPKGASQKYHCWGLGCSHRSKLEGQVALLFSASSGSLGARKVGIRLTAIQ